jgi:hypothetical protein
MRGLLPSFVQSLLHPLLLLQLTTLAYNLKGSIKA